MEIGIQFLVIRGEIGDDVNGVVVVLGGMVTPY
jgi:hypothetical protein